MTRRADVVVIGAGPAGITLAEELASHGLHVMLIEAAGRSQRRRDTQALTGESSGEPFPLVRSRRRGFGGTSTHWTRETGLRVRPLDDIDFASRPCRPNDSWPFGPSTLETYYERALRVIGLEPVDEPDRAPLRDGLTALTWSDGPEIATFQFADNDVFVSRFNGVCRNSKVELVLHASVVKLEGDGQSVQRAAIASPGGRSSFAVAPLFVLACGGIDNARILLMSPGRDGRALGNEHDHVGRYFMDHLSLDTGIIVPNDKHELAVSGFSHQRVGRTRRQQMLWLGSDIIVREGIPNAAFWIDEIDPLYLSPGVSAARSLRAALNAVPRRDIRTHVRNTATGIPQIGAYRVRQVLRRGSRVLGMRIVTEQLPDRNSRIRLSDRRDALGIPLVDVDWRVSAADLDVVVAHQQLLAKLLDDRGVATIADPYDRCGHSSPIMSNAHHMGSTRMHVLGRHGVVDPDGRVHSTSNLYVIGSSVFPTGGYVNPTLTIIALALKTADVIVRQHQPFNVGGSTGREAAPSQHRRDQPT